VYLQLADAIESGDALLQQLISDNAFDRIVAIFHRAYQMVSDCCEEDETWCDRIEEILSAELQANVSVEELEDLVVERQGE
jgi:hypothetical protein